ncbi:DUF6510 family protein [Actinotalea subterranea]|uniref:DUF6510 family protein n=1 Tax=Actinotalea subterranea TaxID=2607497 RepID=UPI0011ED180E|nr:DUF6510 family protein [Actinotalea subterranea]
MTDHEPTHLTDADEAAVDDAYVDGNALAGDLLEIFAMDMTTAVGTCGGCGRTAVLAAARVYRRAPGVVLRCAGCSHVLGRIVRAPDRVVVDLAGLRSISARLPD